MVAIINPVFSNDVSKKNYTFFKMGENGLPYILNRVRTKNTFNGSKVSYSNFGITMSAPVKTNCVIELEEFTLGYDSNLIVNYANTANKWVNLKVFENGKLKSNPLRDAGVETIKLLKNNRYKIEIQCDSVLEIYEIAIEYEVI